MMYTIVLIAFLTIWCSVLGAPAPGYLQEGYGGYGGYGHGGYSVLPAATSYTSRIDVHGAPVLKTYAAPVLAKTYVAAPVVTKSVVPAVSYSAPIVSSGYSYGLGHGYGLGNGYGLGHGYNSLGYSSGYSGLGLGHGYGGYGGYGSGYGGSYGGYGGLGYGSLGGYGHY